jgi:phosphatidylserine/phosphatidylglycerophosphate/cardiolipin synthase-like enzyme
MSKFATGTVVDQENGHGLPFLNVDIEDVSQAHDKQLLNKDPAVTENPSGNFKLSYASYAFNTTRPGAQARQLRLTIRVGRHVIKEVFQNEGAFGDTVEFDKIVIPRAEATSWRATLGKGKESRVSSGNAIRWLADNVDAWKHVADVITLPSNLGVMQLTIDVGDFKKDNPIVVLDFQKNDTIKDDSFIISKDDDRIEKRLLSAATLKTDVRIQIPRMSLDPALIKNSSIVLTALSMALFALGTVALFLIGGAVFILIRVLLVAAGSALVAAGSALAIADYLLPAMPKEFADLYSTKIEKLAPLKKWFAAAGNDSSSVRVRELVHRSFNITHAKVVIDYVTGQGGKKDHGREAVLLGSPFEQVYFDSPEHSLDSGWRGESASKGPIHDVSVAVRGPALNDFQDLVNSQWKFAEPSETLPDHEAPDPQTAGDGEFNSTVQLVLTLDRMFSLPGEDDGEKGVREAYLRAIHFAQRFIYIENQYFYNELVVQALADALTANPNLVVILLLNVSPDMPYYLRWQQRGIKRIVKALTDKYVAEPEPVKTRFRVFSVFSHAAKDVTHPKPRLVDVYLHTKTAIVDNVWATVGSANLDGASMDTVDYSKYAVDGEVRHTEANVVVYEDPPVTPSAVDALRRRLWAEHLGIVVGGQAGNLDVASVDLLDSPGTDWLAFWSKKAQEKLDGLKKDPNQVSLIHILPIDFDYGPYTAGKGKFGNFQDNFKGALKDHYALASCLEHMFGQDKVDEFDLSPPRNLTFRTSI